MCAHLRFFWWGGGALEPWGRLGVLGRLQATLHTLPTLESAVPVWRYLSTTHYAWCHSGDLLAEAEVPLVASDTNVRTSLSGGPSRIL